MATGSLGQLTIDLAANITRFERSLNRAEKLATQRSTAIRRSFVRMAGGITAAVAGISFTRLISDTIKYADTLDKTASKLGLSVESLQEYRIAAELTGVATSNLDVALQRFTRRIGEAAQGEGVLKDITSELGIELRNADGTLRSTESVLNDYANAIQNAESSQEQLRLAFQAFDTEGAALVNTLRNGAEGLDQLRQSARDTGGILSTTLTETAATINDRWTILVDTIGNKFKAATLTAIDAALNLFGVFNNLGDVQQRLLEIENELIEAQAKNDNVLASRRRGADARINRLIAEREELQALEQQIIQTRLAREGVAGLPGIGVEGEIEGAPGEKTAVERKQEENNALIQTEQELTQEIFAELDKRRQAELRTASIVFNSRINLANQATALLQSLAGKSKAAAIAAIAVSKGAAIAQTIVSTEAAAMQARTALIMPGDPSSIGRAEAAAAAIRSAGRLSVALIAATGLSQAANISSGGGGAVSGGAAPGTAANPISITDVTPGLTTEAASMGTITINVNGVVTDEIVQDLIVPAVQDAVNERDVILIRSDSRQAAELIV